MKVKVLLVTLLAFAGLGSSFALASGGKHHTGRDATTTGTTTQCQRAVVFGTASAPQTLVVTVQKSNKNSQFTPNQVITVSVGKTGDTVQVFANGCVTGASSLTARSAILRGPWNHGHDGDHNSTTTTTK